MEPRDSLDPTSKKQGEEIRLHPVYNLFFYSPTSPENKKKDISLLPIKAAGINLRNHSTVIENADESAD